VLRIERKVNRLYFVGSIALLVSGILLLVSPPSGATSLELGAALLAIVSIVIGAVGTWRLVQLAMQRTAMIAADVSGISIEGGRPIAWDQILSIEVFEWRNRVALRGILIKLRDRSGVVASQLGSWWTRAAAAKTPGDIFINEATIQLALLDAVTRINAERPR
jgi:hypothetical protein